MSIRHLKRGPLARNIKLAVLPHTPRLSTRSFYTSTTTTLTTRHPDYRLSKSPQLYPNHFKTNYSTTTDEMAEEPTGLIAKSGIELLTFGQSRPSPAPTI
jgi:hypothetical protein